MDLLGGYGSGSDSEPGSPSAGAGGTAVLLLASLPRPPAVSAAPGVPHAASADPTQLLASLPAPSGAKVRSPPPLLPAAALRTLRSRRAHKVIRVHG